MFDTVTPLAMTSTPEILDQIRAEEREISRHRARQLELIRELSRRGVSEPSPTSLASQLDVDPGTAKQLIDTARRTPELGERFAELRAGATTFDRTAALGALSAEGATRETMREAADRDIAGIRKLRALTKRIRRRDERKAHAERFLRSWPSLDESVGFIHAQLTGHDWTIVNRALDERADRFPADSTDSRDQRRADALVAIALDWLDGSPGPSIETGPVVTVMIDGERAAATDCEAGVTLTAGPRIGPDTLDRILCEGSVELVVDPGSGRPLAVGPTTRVVPPKVRRFVLTRDGGCTVDGCNSRYRLEVHHIDPRSKTGTHDVENLTTVCWWHHQVALHGAGGIIDPDSPPHRIRIIPPAHAPP
jgi:hypothetical protein